MRPIIKGFVVLKLLWLLCTVTLVFAGEKTIASPENIPIAKWIVALVLASWGGATMLLQKRARGDENERWVWLIVSGMMSSISAGVLVFFGAMHFDVPPFVAPVAIFIAGYGGARTLDAALARLEKFIGEAKI